MNRTMLPETSQCVNPAWNHCPDMTVLERQRKCLLQHLGSSLDYFVPGFNTTGAFSMTSQGSIVADALKRNNCSINPGKLDQGEYSAGRSMEVPAEEKVKASVLVDQESSRAGDGSLGKRKFDILNNIKSEDGDGEEKMEDTAQSNHASKSNKEETNSKENAKNSEATDSHSLAERVRREKISERMKFLQDLVPGCDKITGKAGMLDEIINYVQSLQRQVEFLSMKLAVTNPWLDLDIDTLFAKEITPACAPTQFPIHGDALWLICSRLPPF
ncbi:hypothetical protein MLD38_027028 [Melastoma candidum]|uniref:Uncharacterized protein n=1 Tax=Melastoma candidum TaxID=119954 RepID=A0ACB9P3B5_9MYRT|nr:hypothetical protein MLD38_027028 [Melastoma candidum]